jgi:hypothetical protein
MSEATLRRKTAKVHKAVAKIELAVRRRERCVTTTKLLEADKTVQDTVNKVHDRVRELTDCAYDVGWNDGWEDAKREILTWAKEALDGYKTGS